MICLNWFSLAVNGSAIYRISQKFKASKQVIRDFSKQNYSDLEKQMQEAHECMIQVQSKTLQNPTISNAADELEMHKKINYPLYC